MLRYFVLLACLLVSAAASGRSATLIQADYASPHYQTVVAQCGKHVAGAKRHDCIQAKLLALQLRDTLLARRQMAGEVTIAR
ncbi:hypothetical protein [Burkholderia ubonensis]|uniref:hypothetical protein n=1 Tax=Burkholderia ubonensis TaxID=101571 RepID=UPI00076D3D73|nr:hypothetical protein [Burkholderia ubonensis]KVP75378.1 hypothetical protein WJ93_08150 [Burkholderia ubonensis]